MAQELMKRQSDSSVAVAERTRNAATYTPRFDIVETDNELVLYGDLPGVSKQGLDISFENGELAIQAAVEPRHAGREYLYGEYGIGDYHRRFTMSDVIDADKITAELHNGVLTLHLPKAESVKPRRIAVTAAD